MSEDTEALESADEFDLPRGRRGAKLETPGDIQRELARLYRATKAGVVSVGACNCLTQTLFTLSKVAEGAALERVMKRLEELEARTH